MNNDKEIKMPSFLKKALSVNCFLGKNDALPIEEEYPFVYLIMKERFKEVNDFLSKKYGKLDRNDPKYLKQKVSELYKNIREKEKPNLNKLEQICYKVVTELFDIPQDLIEFNLQLVDKISPQHSINIKPQSNITIKYEFEDSEEYENIQQEVLKRRLIDAFIQGAATSLSKCHHLFLNDIYEIDSSLINDYDELNAINDYLLFIEDNKITDENTFQGAYVEVILGQNDECSKINAQGLTFPFLLFETIRGLMELFASHGLPQNNQMANYILKQADFLIAEPWDLRTGIKLWEKLIYYDKVKAKVTPYFFSELCKLNVHDFNYTVKNILSNTKKGKLLFNDLLSKAKYIKRMNEFENNLYKKHIDDASVLNDGYYSSEELDGFLLQS